MAVSSLHVTLAHRVLDHIRAERLPAGHHLTEQSLEQVLGTSRSPVRGALTELAARGIVVSRPPRRGLFLAVDAAELGVADEAGEEQDYLQVARDRLDGILPMVLTEQAAMRRYGLTRERVRRVLQRAAKEGWIEPRPSRKGWSFLPMIDGPDACAESYALRAALEPAAMLMPGFQVDPAALARLRRQQEALAGGGHRIAGRAELFDANATFHEVLAGMSGNRFAAQVIARQNQLRRLLEYRVAADDRARVGRQCEEHLAILALIEHGERDAAAQLLGEHLRAAGEAKVRHMRHGLSRPARQPATQPGTQKEDTP